MTGSSIAHYRITGKLGEGGMGAVYRAHDSRLGRDVAIKVLPPALANDADYIARFQREARVLASLNHPNIAAIYGLEEKAIVMELVEGTELKGPLPLDEAVRIAKQIADAMEAAHERGIVHRDLKPANVKITADGKVKVLDFGLAKAGEPTKAASASIANSPTLTIHATTAGMILGTAAYMSPEQARGQAVDKRADIWAFGVVLWEMLTGRQMFEGETVSDVLAAVLRTEPDLSVVPLDIRPVLAACLEKNPRDRLRDIGDWKRLMIAAPATVSPRPNRVPWIVAATAGAMALAGWVIHSSSPQAQLQPMITLRAELGDGRAVIGPRYPGHMFAISPEGTKLAYVGEDKESPSGMSLSVRDLAGHRVQKLPGTDDSHTPFFSPDGSWIAFWSDGKLRKIRADGGAAMVVCELTGLRGGVWTVDDQLIVSPGGGPLMRVSADGGTPTPLTKPENGEVSHRRPQILAGSDVLLFSSAGNITGPWSLHGMSLKSGKRKLLQEGAVFGREIRGGYLVFQKDTTLYGSRFDADAMELRGKPVPLVDNVHITTPGGAIVSFSDTGNLVHSRTLRQATRLFRVTRGGRGEPYPFVLTNHPELSPDGRLVLFNRDQALWIADLNRRTEVRLASPGHNFSRPVWTRDGAHVVYSSTDGLWMVRSDGGTPPVKLRGDSTLDATSFHPDGRTLLLLRTYSQGRFGFVTTTLSTRPTPVMGGEPSVFVEPVAAAGAASPKFSPDGRWVAYHSSEDGSPKVYVRPYPGPGARVQISRGWGQQPRWSRTKNEILYHGGDRRIMVVPYTTEGGSFVPGEARAWAEERAYEQGGLSTFDIMPDGETVILLGNIEGGGEDHLTFVLNFFDEVRRRVR